MKEFDSIDDILDFAMSEEQKAVDFYSELSLKSKTEDMKKIFSDFAKEEMNHKARLIKIKTEKSYSFKNENVSDLKISDYVVNIEVTENMTYQDVLVVAMKKEKSAFKLYLTLSERADSTEMKDVFLSLAQEESKHKLRFELEYDEFVLRDN